MTTRNRQDPTGRALKTFVKLMRAAGAVAGKAEISLEESGLTPSQFAVLEALYHKGPMCLGAVAEKVLSSSGNLTLVATNLENAGLVRRQQGREDRRFFQLHLTPKGRRLIAEIFPEHAQRIRGALSVLNPSEQEQLARLCKKLGLALADRTV